MAAREKGGEHGGADEDESSSSSLTASRTGWASDFGTRGTKKARASPSSDRTLPDHGFVGEHGVADASTS
jgi:hypothetical protein